MNEYIDNINIPCKIGNINSHFEFILDEGKFMNQYELVGQIKFL